MEYTKLLTDYQWNNIYAYLSEYKSIYVRNEEDVRRFVEGVFWIVRSGAQWRLLPKEYGKWNNVYKRFADWSDKGIWHKMLYYTKTGN